LITESSYSNSSEIDEKPVRIHFLSLVKDDRMEPNEDCDVFKNMNDKTHESTTTAVSLNFLLKTEINDCYLELFLGSSKTLQ
jgi:hypothetical protein